MPHMGRTQAMMTTDYTAVWRGNVGRDALGRVAGQEPAGFHSASNASTPLPWAAAFAQQKIFQDQCPIAGSERRAANSAPHFAVSGLWSSYRFDDLIKRGTAWALEK